MRALLALVLLAAACAPRHVAAPNDGATPQVGVRDEARMA